MSENSGLIIDVVPASRTQTILTVRLGGDVLVVDKLDLAKPKSRDAFAATLCEGRPGVDRAEVDRKLLELAAERAQQSVQTEPRLNSGPTRQELLEAMPATVRVAARSMLDAPLLMRRIVDDIGAIGVAGEKELAATLYLVGTSRLLNRPLATIVTGPSSSGKSHLIEQTASMFPPEGVLLATQITPQALFYMEPGSLVHKFVVAGERSRKEDDESAEATRALREMLSAGRLSKLIPVKVGGRMRTELVEQDGPIAFVESTTLNRIFDEDLNRSILLSTDERQSQTRLIIDSVAEKYAGNSAGPSRGEVIERHHALQRMLEPHGVLIPFAPTLAQHFEDGRVEARRAFPHTLSLIQASALLHQFQRQRDGDGHILADANDYQLARRLLSGPLARQLGGGLSEPAKRFLVRLSPVVKSEPFTTRDIRKHLKDASRSVSGWLTELADLGAANVIEPQHGPKPAIWKLVGTLDDLVVGDMLPPMSVLFPEVACQLSNNTQTLMRQAV